MPDLEEGYWMFSVGRGLFDVARNPVPEIEA